ncbi:MAG: proton-conducting transporter membrane subunit, partial [Fusobacteria bacterium]|nr:proton-conducting transporter membrane subunit [Fusobacteriota bacterium]
MIWLILSIAFITGASCLQLFIPKSRTVIQFSSYTTGIGLILTLISSTLIYLRGGSSTLIITLSGFLGKIVFVQTPLSYFFILFVATLSLISLLFSSLYLKPYANLKRVKYHLFVLQGLTVCMLLLPLTGSVLLFLMVWEGMSMTAFFLLYFNFESVTVQVGGKIYFIFMHIGFFILVVAFSLLTFWCGSSDFSSYLGFFLHATLFQSSLLFLLFLLGFGTKAGIFPLYVWLPKAHVVAPGNASPIMSGIMIKMGIYGIVMFLLMIPTFSLT